MTDQFGHGSGWLELKGALICCSNIARQGDSPCTPADQRHHKMAIYHLSAKTISRGKGQSAIASAAYRSEQKLFDSRSGKTFDYSRKNVCTHSEIIAPKNAPEWVYDREALWNMVESVEKRKDSQLAREIDIALPIELSHQEQIDLVREFVRSSFVSAGMVADVNVHQKDVNPHAHIMLTTRSIDENGFGLKNIAWNKKPVLMEWRKDWADKANHYLAKADHDIRIDHRSYAELGVDLEPQNKIGTGYHQKDKESLDRYQDHQRIARENGQKIISHPEVGLDLITRRQAVFGEIDIYKLAHTHSIDVDQYRAVCDALVNSPEIVQLGNDDGWKARYTTKKVIEAENRLMDNAVSMADRFGHLVEDRFIDQARVTRTLSSEHDRALAHVCKSGDVCCVVGYAGSGKSYLLGAAREALEAQGYHVKGAALAGIAAEGLRQESGIDSKTIAKQLWEIENGKDRFTKRDVLVIDESGMVGTRQMDRLVGYARKHGAKVVLVGDDQQLQPIEMGGPFRGILERVGGVKLTDIRRQQQFWQRLCTRDLEGPDAEKSIDTYEGMGRIHEHDTQEQAAGSVVDRWKDLKSKDPSATALMLAYRNADVHLLNQGGREAAKDLGLLSGQDHAIKTSKGVLDFCKGDRIVFLRNDYQMNVRNGSLGTIERIRRSNIQVRLDNGDRLVFDAREYNTFNYGYASTVHKSQGATVDYAFVLADPLFDRHTALTALSRHRQDVSLYWSKELFDTHAALKKTLLRERPKELAIDFCAVRGIEHQLFAVPIQKKTQLSLIDEQVGRHGERHTEAPDGEKTNIGVDAGRSLSRRIVSTAKSLFKTIMGNGQRAEDMDGWSENRPVETRMSLAKTIQSIERQFEAMGCLRYDAMVRDPKTGREIKTNGTADEIIKTAAWIKRMNANGYDVYIRPGPYPGHNIFLVAHLDATAVEKMMKNGHDPALVVETRPGTFQAWVKVEEHKKRLATSERKKMVSKVLNHSYAGSGITDEQGYGRLAGFINQEERLWDNSKQKFYCVLRHASGKPARKETDIADRALNILYEQNDVVQTAKKINAIIQNRADSNHVDKYRSRMRKLVERHGKHLNWSHADCIVAKDLILDGCDVSDIKRAITAASPGSPNIKWNCMAYTDGILDRVLKAPELKKTAEPHREKALRRERELSRSMTHGPSR